MLSIHQSQFLSWSPLYYKVLRSDHFIVLDHVQFQKNGVQNRNLIKTPQGELWITIPVKHHEMETPINEILIYNVSVYDKILKTIESNYKKSIYYTDVYKIVYDILSKKIENLHDLNNSLFLSMLNILESNTNILYSSQMNPSSKKDDLVIELIKKSGDNEYLSGSGALAYMDLEKFRKENIKVYVSKFNYLPYKQLWENKIGFIKNLSILDLVINDIDNAKKYLLNNGNLTRVI